MDQEFERNEIEMKWSCGFQLRVRSGPSRGNTYIVDAPVLKIGRAIRPGERVPGWIRVSDDTVSRLHCELFWQEDRQCFRLLHRSTTNSSYLNGEVVEDAEVFDGDILEIGATSLEVQKADLRWTKPDDKSIREWAVESGPAKTPEVDTLKIELPRKIPGATVREVRTPSNRKFTMGPQMDHLFLAEDGKEYALKGIKVRFGSSQAPPLPEPEKDENGEDIPPKPLPRFDTEYEFDTQNFSYYNLILMYDEIVQDYKAARVGPNSRIVRVFRKQSGLVWQTELPEGVELALLEGDHIQCGDLVLAYQKKAAVK